MGWGSPVDMGGVSGLDGARRKASLQTSVVAANAEPAADVEGHVPEVAGRSRGAAHDHAINERRASHSGAESEQNHVAPPSRGSPQHLGDQSGARVVVGADRQAIHSQPVPAACDPSRKFRSPGKRLTRVVAASITPLQPIPIPSTGPVACLRTEWTKSSQG